MIFTSTNLFEKNLPNINILLGYLWKREPGTRNGEWGTGNGEREMRLTFYHKVLRSKEFESAEFIDNNSFFDSWRLSSLTLLNIGNCHLLGHVFKKMLQKLQFGEILCSAQIKDSEFNVTIVFRDSWCLLILNAFQYWHLSCFRPQIWKKNSKCFIFDETLYSAKIEGTEFNEDKSFL